MDEMMNTEGSERGVYELGFIIVPEVTEEKLPEAFGAIKDLITDKGAIPISEEFPKHLPLAYTMEKTINNKIERYKEGWFAWIKFELESEGVKALEAALKARHDLVRYLLVTTVRENTVAAKRGFAARRRPGVKTPGTEGKEGAPEMTKEEIDREIEALVDNTEKEA